MSRSAGRLLLLALMVITSFAVVSECSAQPPVNVVPVQLQFVKSPWVFKWSTAYTYKLKLYSKSAYTQYGHVEFQGFTISKTSGPPVASATRGFVLKPGQNKIITISFTTPEAPAYGNFENWCISADIYVETMAIQSARTCAAYDTGK